MAAITRKNNVFSLTEPHDQKSASDRELKRKRLTADLRADLATIIDRLDQFFTECALQLPSNLSSCSGKFSYDGGLEGMLGTLLPWADKIDSRVHEVLAKANADLESDYGYMSKLQQETAYAIGMLAGARLAGYSRERLNQMAEFLTSTW